MPLHHHNAVDQTERSLSEQLRITDTDIQDRKDLLGFAKCHEADLLALRPAIRAVIDNVVSEFYDHQVTVPKIRSIIGDKDTMSRLKSAMRAYILNIFEGEYGLDYVNARLRIGKVHARIGVPPKLYVSSLHRLEGIITSHIMEEATLDAPPEALTKVMLFDLQFVFDTYIQGLVSEVELARDEMINYSKSLESVVAERTHKIENLAHTDDLTGLWNRRSLFIHGNKDLQASKRRHAELTLLFLDIDNFKAINDQLGHLGGDAVLQNVATVISSTIRESDKVFRFGGDEFCILLPDTGRNQVRRICTEIKEALKPVLPEYSGVSIGIKSTGPETYCDIEELLSAADAHMYSEKSVSLVSENKDAPNVETRPEKSA